MNVTSRRLTGLFAAAALAVSGLAVASPAQAAPAKPGVVVDYALHKIKVKPKKFYPYKDLHYSNVKWTSLTSKSGRGTAVRNVNTCKPDCAAGNYQRTKVKLAFSKVKLSDCRRVFSRLKETEVKSKRSTVRRLPVWPKSGC